MTTVKLEHCRKLNYCSRGIRELFSKYNMDYADFLENGIDSKILCEKTNNDWMVLQAVEVANGEFK